MIIDHRTYRIKAGHTQTHLQIYEEYGFKAQSKHLGQPFAYLFAETGDVNTYVHIWIYENAEDRNRKRTALWQDSEWLAYIEKNSEAGYLIKQESKLMSPAAFAPVRRA